MDIEKSDSVLEANDFRLTIGGKTAFTGNHFQIKQGEVVLLRGPNGAGKSTFVKKLLGYQPSADIVLSGDLCFKGNKLVNESDFSSFREQIGYCEQEPLGRFNSIFDELFTHGLPRVLSQCAPYLRQHPEIDRSVIKEEADSLFHSFNADLEKQSVAHMSGGERQIVGIIAALSRVGAPLYILDEPLNNLDTKSIRELFKRIENKKREESFLIISHCRLFSKPNRVYEIQETSGGRTLQDVTSAYQSYNCLEELTSCALCAKEDKQ